MTRSERGFTLIETILGLTVMTIMIVAIGQLFVDNLRVLSLSKARNLAAALATEQIEYLRDLPYDSINTQHGLIIPHGLIPDEQTVTRGNYKFRMTTEITFVDDPYDGNAAGTISGKPRDLYPGDYKRIQVSVYLVNTGRLVAKVTSDASAKTAETNTNTGVISITVVDSHGIPVPNAVIRITNSTTSPAVDITTNTDNQGIVMIPNMPLDSSNHYHTVASLTGYSSEQTYPDPSGVQTATKQDLNVLLQQVTYVTFTIDRLATLNLTAVDTAGNPIANLPITITGAKAVKLNPTEYKYSSTKTTDSSGNISIPELEWDSYSYDLPSGYYLVSAQPYAPTVLNPGASTATKLVISTSVYYPRITTTAPQTAAINTNALVTITGANLNSGSTVRLVKSGHSDIVATNVVSSGNGATLDMKFDLDSAVTGLWDIVITTGTGTVTQIGGFDVTN